MPDIVINPAAKKKVQRKWTAAKKVNAARKDMRAKIVVKNPDQKEVYESFEKNRMCYAPGITGAVG